MFSITILGNNSAIPAFGRNPTAQVLQLDGLSFLIDCGEGTQMQLSKYKVKRSKISHVFISHLHGDHFFGLMGLLTSMGLQNRTQPLHIHGPAMLRDIINMQLSASDTDLPYTIHFHALGADGIIADTEQATVESFQVRHTISCWGFIFREKKKPRKLLPERLQAYGVPHDFFEALQSGADYRHPKGTLVPNEELTVANARSRSYAFCADTIYDPSLAEKIKNVDVLYHETTYLKDHEKKAALRFHSTTVQAAAIAQKANAGKLLIGHFSSKYEYLDEFLAETKAIFPATELALEGACFPIG